MKKEEKVLASLDILEFILSIIGFITCCMVYALTSISERYFFILMAFLLGINIIGNIKKLEVKFKKQRVIKYSKKLMNQKI